MMSRSCELSTVRRPNHYLHVGDILPEAFVGAPDAPVVLLGNNPGFREVGLLLKQDPVFVKKMRDT